MELVVSGCGRREAEKNCFIFSHLLLLHVPTWPALPLFSSSPNSFFFHTSACIIFSAVNFFRSTSPTLCYVSLLLLPATKVATVNDRRCYSDTILGVWGLFLPIRSVKSFFFRCLPELPSLNTSYGEGNTAVKKWRLFWPFFETHLMDREAEESEVVGWLWSGWKGQTGSENAASSLRDGTKQREILV